MVRLHLLHRRLVQLDLQDKIKNKAVLNKKIITVIMFFLLTPVSVFSAETGKEQNDSKKDILVVQGTGYPPIKAQSAAQARLMARRAAIIDTYRNALAAKGIKDYEESDFYSELQGFVKGMNVIEEEYLEDGGIRILAHVSAKDVRVSSGVTAKKPKETGRGPLRVTLDEWYKIIKKLVRIE